MFFEVVVIKTFGIEREKVPLRRPPGTLELLCRIELEIRQTNKPKSRWALYNAQDFFMYVIKVCVYCDGHKHRPIGFLSYFNGELFIPFHFVPHSLANIQFGREEKNNNNKKRLSAAAWKRNFNQ